MQDAIEQMVKNWADNDLQIIGLRIAHLEKWLYKTYEPDKFNNGDFWTRLEAWLRNIASDDERKIAFQLLTEIFYTGPTEFEELYRCAYEGPVARWLIERESIDIFDLNAQRALRKAAEETWFCPITDSFRINSFFHVNNIPAGSNFRPDWHSLAQLADPVKINSYCASNNIRRLVMLEDFVGGGSQSLGAVQFAASLTHQLEILFVPLIICPDGDTNARALEMQINQLRPNALKYEAVLPLSTDAFFTSVSQPSHFGIDFAARLRHMLATTYGQVSGNALPGTKPYDPYGFPTAKPTGGLVVMYSNTPDNTLPFIHWRPQNGAWNPVFPRHSRM